jgi:hypothetical protein
LYRYFTREMIARVVKILLGLLYQVNETLPKKTSIYNCIWKC